MDGMLQEISADADSLGQTSLADALVDELETARRRMRHLAPWHVTPVPMYSSTGAVRAAKSGGTGEERRRRLALQVLAVQMAQARSTSALSWGDGVCPRFADP